MKVQKFYLNITKVLQKVLFLLELSFRNIFQKEVNIFKDNKISKQI